MVEKRFAINPWIAWQENKRSGFSYANNLLANSFYEFDGIANEIWKMITQNYSNIEIVETISCDYEVDVRDVERDVEEVVNQMIEKQILREIKKGEKEDEEVSKTYHQRKQELC